MREFFFKARVIKYYEGRVFGEDEEQARCKAHDYFNWVDEELVGEDVVKVEVEGVEE